MAGIFRSITYWESQPFYSVQWIWNISRVGRKSPKHFSLWLSVNLAQPDVLHATEARRWINTGCGDSSNRMSFYCPTISRERSANFSWSRNKTRSLPAHVVWHHPGSDKLPSLYVLVPACGENLHSNYHTATRSESAEIEVSLGSKDGGEIQLDVQQSHQTQRNGNVKLAAGGAELLWHRAPEIGPQTQV